MKAVYLEGMRNLRFREISAPVPGAGELLIKVKSVGICGSDVHYWEHGRIGSFIVEKPLILGHEVSGEVASLGGKVTGFAVGDQVVIEPGVPCWQCRYCREGKYNLCRDMKFYATPPVDGAFCEYVAIDSSMVFKIPEGLSLEVATLVEPLAVGTFAVKRGRPGLGERVVIFGSGVVGLCVMMAAREAGAGHITMVDVREERLGLARELGADLGVNVSTQPLPDENSCDLAFECSGVPVSLVNAAGIVRPGGRIVQLGLGAGSTQEAPVVELTIKEIDMITVFRYAHAFSPALEILGRRRDRFQKMITHRYTFDEIESGFMAARYDNNAVKVVINL